MSPTRFTRTPTVAGSTLAFPDRSKSPAETWRHDLTLLRTAGFQAVDLVDTWLSPAEMNPEEQEQLRDVIGQVGLHLVGVSVIRKSIIDPDRGPSNMAHSLASIDAAHRLGAPVLCIGFHRPLTAQQMGDWPFWAVEGPTDTKDDATMTLAIGRLRELCRYAATFGIQMSLELYEDTLLGWGRDAAALVEAVGEPNLGINPDLANIWRLPRPLQESWRETLQACAPHMNYWHVKNFRRAPVWPAGPFVTLPTPMADGDIDYREAFELVASAGYTGPICIEHYGGDRLWAQRQALAYVKWLLSEGGGAEP